MVACNHLMTAGMALCRLKIDDRTNSQKIGYAAELLTSFWDGD